jgi:hypothetical protein
MRSTRTIRRRSTRLTLISALGCGLLLASPASAALAGENSASVTPPRGIPDLASMALAPSDLGPQARVQRQGYVKPSEGVVASYARLYRPGTARVAGKQLLFLESDIDLMRNVAEARRFMTFAPLVFALLDPDDLKKSFRRDGLKATYVRIGMPSRVRAGEQALSGTIKIGTRGGEIRFLVAFVRVNRVVAAVGAMGVPRAKLSASHAGVLLRGAAQRVLTGLRPVATSLPAISGTAVVGGTLTTSKGSWRNAPGRFAYGWSRCDVGSNSTACGPIPGATGPTYTLVAGDQGYTIRSHVTATNRHGSGSTTSDATPGVVPGPGAPTNSTAPTISGTTSVGQTLTADVGAWTSSPTFTFEWRRCDASGATCSGNPVATSQTYALTTADAGSRIKVTVTATNASGWATAESALTAVVSS